MPKKRETGPAILSAAENQGPKVFHPRRVFRGQGGIERIAFVLNSYTFTDAKIV